VAIAAIAEERIAGTPLAADSAALAERLRRATVTVRGRGPGGGSGVIWQSDGLIITNAHVAQGPQAIVDLWDGRTFEARVIERDPRRDLAALTIDATGLPAALIGDSRRLRVGELVLAMGNPFGVVGALSAGIVHTIGPHEEHGQQQWVQADVRLAPGNSGGPLVDARGYVVGINSMIYGGLALSVPSNAVERFLRRGRRPHLGVTLQPVVVTVAGDRLPGLLIVGIDDGSLAETSGLFIGDILVGANGQPFEHLDDLGDALSDAGAGATLSLDIVRAGRRFSCSVVLAGETDPGRTPEPEEDAA
jgi:serine protease Do